VERRKLALILSLLSENPNQKYKFEQYSITPDIAATTLLAASRDIKGKVVYDLGCGAGRFAIGAALLGAKKVFGVDIDKDVLEIARANVKLVEEKTGLKISERCEWLTKDVKELKAEADTVVQFPPFANDLLFFKKALQIARNVYSIHKKTEKTRKRLAEVCKKFGARIELEKSFKYKIPWEESKKVGHEVFLIVAKKPKVSIA
jgi:putative methylase